MDNGKCKTNDILFEIHKDIVSMRKPLSNWYIHKLEGDIIGYIAIVYSYDIILWKYMS